MSSSEDTKGGDPDKLPEPPDTGQDSSTGLFNEPTPEAHTTVSQTQGDVSRPTSPAEAEHGKSETDVQVPVEAHATMNQGSDISSLDADSLTVKQKLIEGIQGEADSNNAAVEPKTPETEQPPVSMAVQTTDTTTTSNLTQTALTTATTTTTQSVATTTTSNTHSTIALVHQASIPEKEAISATPVPGLTDPSSEELAAAEGSGVAPQQHLKTAINDQLVSYSMSGLQLGNHSIPEMDPKSDKVTSGGSGPLSENQNPSAQPPMSSTPNKPFQELQNVSPVSATVSSEQLGSTINAAHGSTTSVPGFESASDIFHGDASSDVLAAQQMGPDMSESVTDSEMTLPSRKMLKWTLLTKMSIHNTM